MENLTGITETIKIILQTILIGWFIIALLSGLILIKKGL